MARRNEHNPEQIREMVLQAAETLVIEEGFAALKVREIAMEIGYTVGSIYRVFDNMPDLIQHLKGRTLDELTLQLTQVSTAQPPEQQLLSLAQTYLHFAHQNFNRWQMLYEQQTPHVEPLPVWYQEKIDLVFQRIVALFTQIKPNASIDQHQRAAQALWYGIQGVCSLSLTGTPDACRLHDTEKNIQLLVRSFIQGWLIESAS